MLEITKEDWAQWRDNPVTRSFFGLIAQRREEAIEQLAFGNTTSPSKQNILVGAVNAYTHILKTDYHEEV